MRRVISPVWFIAAVGSGFVAVAARPAAAENFALDAVHSSVTFKCEHMGLSWVHGRFNSFSGDFSYDKADPAKSTFELTIKAESIDTGNAARDNHLKGGDFFDVKQFATLSFKSKSVKSVKDGLEVKGDFTMHGQTKPISFILKGGKEKEFQGKKHIGFWTDLTIKRSEFGMIDKMPGALGDEVPVSISFEGVGK